MRARLLATLILAVAPGISVAADLSVVVGGWSHHFVSASDREALNQTQGTIGVELSTADWDFQASHLTDSFGCSSNQIGAARRWELFQPRPWFRGGLMVGAVAAYRCDTPPTEQTVATEILQTTGWGGDFGSVNFGPGYSTYCNFSTATQQETCVLMKVQQVSVENKKWVYGVVPGAYVEFGDMVNFEMTLIRSPWTGHHLVLYGQLSIKVFSF